MSIEVLSSCRALDGYVVQSYQVIIYSIPLTIQAQYGTSYNQKQHIYSNGPQFLIKQILHNIIWHRMILHPDFSSKSPCNLFLSIYISFAAMLDPVSFLSRLEKVLAWFAKAVAGHKFRKLCSSYCMISIYLHFIDPPSRKKKVQL